MVMLVVVVAEGVDRQVAQGALFSGPWLVRIWEASSAKAVSPTEVEPVVDSPLRAGRLADPLRGRLPVGQICERIDGLPGPLYALHLGAAAVIFASWTAYGKSRTRSVMVSARTTRISRRPCPVERWWCRAVPFSHGNDLSRQNQRGLAAEDRQTFAAAGAGAAAGQRRGQHR
ncbi:hypothetical protein [Streptomyces sp. NPDC001139]